MRRFVTFLSLAGLGSGLVGLSLSACAKDKPAASATATAAPKTVSDFFPMTVGSKQIRIQLAVLQFEQERGLMQRRDLGPDEGMIFVYERPQQMRFWMHNTPTPLDIGYFDENGVLLEVYAMQPFDESPVSSRSTQVKFPLEMNQGWYSANGIRPGAKLDLKALADALQARGFVPAKFGLK